MERNYSTEDLREAGASDSFISMYLSAAPGRHHLRSAIDEGHPGKVLENGGNPANGAGGFFTKVWEGEIMDAFLHADGSNAPLMLDVLGTQKILESAVNIEGYQMQWAQKMINQKAEKFGFDPIEV